jgi:DNA-binding beta-propeller fold protein YncE
MKLASFLRFLHPRQVSRLVRLAAVSISVAVASLAAPTLRAQVLVSDYNLGRVLRYDADGSSPTVLIASASGGLDQPHRARIGPDGLLYVASAGSDQILRYRADTGAFVGEFVGFASGIDYPVDFMFRPDGFLYVTSQQTSSVLRFDSATGARDLDWIASAPSLSAPSGLAFDDAGHLFVSGRFSYNLARFDAATGAHQLTFGDVPFALGLTLLPDGRLLAASGYDNTLEAFANIASASPTQSTLITGLDFPVGVELDPATGTLLVANYGSGSISRHALADGSALSPFTSGGLLNGPNYFTVITPAAVPEPATAALLLGLCAFSQSGLRRRPRPSGYRA